jgi:phospholipase C
MSSPTRHVIVLMLENRSFDHLLAFSNIPDLNGVDTTKTNPSSRFGDVPMTNAAPNVIVNDPNHEFEDVDTQLYGCPRSPGLRPVTLAGFANNSGRMQCYAWIRQKNCRYSLR